MAGKLSHFLKSNSLLPPPFCCRRGLGTCDALRTLSHYLRVALNRGMEGKLVQLNFLTAFDRISH